MWPFAKRVSAPRVEILSMRPEDRIVLETPDRITQQQADDIRHAFADAAGIAEGRVIIVTNVTVRVLREEEPPPPPVMVAAGRWP